LVAAVVLNGRLANIHLGFCIIGFDGEEMKVVGGNGYCADIPIVFSIDYLVYFVAFVSCLLGAVADCQFL